MMKRTKIYRRRDVLTFIVTLLLFSTILSACASAAVEPSDKEEAAKVEEPAEEAEEVRKEEAAPEAEATPEPELESTPEPTPEVVVYEGIDMESTLPGTEWIATFKGIIEEPKLVVFNDTTNKKIILENGEKVKFAMDDDVLGIYLPGDARTSGSVDPLKHIVFGALSVVTLDTPMLKYKAGDEATTEQVVEYNGEEITLTATLIFIE